MSNLNTKFKKILEELEKNIQDSEKLEKLKVELFDLYNNFFEELNKMEEISTVRMVELSEAQAKLESKVNILQNDIKEIQKDIYEDDMEGEFKINCPYCNREIELEANELPDEVKCPDCNNVIELDWGACDCDEHNHEVGGCNGGCKGCEMDNNQDDM